MSIDGYGLPAHVRACVDVDCLLFLDLRRNRYWAAPLARLAETAGPARGALIDRLLKEGLLTPGGVAIAMARRIERPHDAQPPLEGAPSRASGARVLWACARAAMDLQSGNLERAFRALGRRKRRAGNARTVLSADVAHFHRMRPWYPARRVCLFDSLALMHFLVSRRHRPDLVVGVRARPFAAHCWVQCAGVVINDALDHCRSFTPLASV